MVGAARRMSGFNLVELMVGMTIAMMGLAAVGSMMITFTKKRATVTQTLGAQDNGVMAMYRLERDMMQAGYGLMPLQQCTMITDGTNSFIPSPVIISASSTGSDTLQVNYISSTNGMFGAERVDAGGYSVTLGSAVTNPADTSSTVSTFSVRSTVGFSAQNLSATPPIHGDRVVLAPTSTQAAIACTLVRLVAVASASSGTSGATNGYLGNLGSFSSNTYTINGGFMELAEFGSAANRLVDDIVFLKAQYGLATSSTGSTVSSWTSTTPSDVRRVIAVRVGVVARSALKENETIDAPSTLSVLPVVSGTSTVSTPSAGACATDGSTSEVKCTVPDTHYRYRAYSTVIPLRNVLWTRCPTARPDCSPW